MNFCRNQKLSDLETTERITFSCRTKVGKKLRLMVAKRGCTLSDFIRQAVEEYIEKIDAALEVEKRNEFFEKFESEK